MKQNTQKNNIGKNLIFGTSSATKGAFYHNMNLQQSADPNANRAKILIALQKSSWFERLWYPFFILAGLICLIFIKPFNFELCFAVFSFWIYLFANNLLANGKRFGIILSIISASLYTIVSFISKVYGEVIINILLYIPLDVFAVISFKKNLDKKSNDLNVRALNIKAWALTIASLIICSTLIFLLLHFLLKQVSPLLNAISISAFLTALIIRNLRFKEFWYFNILGNIITLTMWIIVSISTPDQLFSLPFAISSLASLMNNVYGIIVWKSFYRKTITNGGIYVKKKIKINRVIKLRRKFTKLQWDRDIESAHQTTQKNLGV